MDINLSPLLGLSEEMPPLGELVAKLVARERLRVAVAEGAKPFLWAALHQRLRTPLLVITPHPEGARKLLDQLSLWCPPGTPVQLFPEPDALPYERLRPDITTLQERLRTLWLLTKRDRASPLIIAPAWAIAQKTVPYGDFARSCQRWQVGMKLSLGQLLERGQALGYVMERAVEVPGEMSHRGGIVDIFPLNSETPFRLELLGNEIESIRAFDPASQRSIAAVSEIELIPAREMLVSPELALALSSWQGEGRDRFEEELGWLLNGHAFPGQEFYAPLFNKGSFLDYLPPGTLLVLDETQEMGGEIEEMERRAEELRRARQGELPPQFPVPYFPWAELESQWQSQAPLLELSRWESSPEDLRLPFDASPSYQGQWPLLTRELEQRRKQGYRLVIVSQQSQRLGEILKQEGIPVLPSLDGAPFPGSVSLLQGSLTQGWVSSALGLWVLSDSELFGFTKERRLSKKRPVKREAFLTELRPGEYVVHTEHGIARYEGMLRMDFEGEEKEYLVLEYAQGAKLYVPSDQLDRVSRYIGARGVPPALSRLGTQEWQRSKERVRQAAGELAQELLKLYAFREVLSGFTFSLDSDWQRELEASFPYVETTDQLRAVTEVKADMERARPMDRLVCGDVGYGKTEVGLRAAFKAVADGKQVAVLVPTTVLAQQHYDTFRKRLAPFPVTVGMLSRFLSGKEQGEVVQGLKQGKVDICVGTHRLLQRDIAFKDLGLVIIDEEQRFGVKHKERLKQMRQEVDVLTLSATPIPRTLYMALAGVRDMSPMDTPPEERLPINSYVAEYNDRLVREAVLRELERGGQVFFVHNRVQTILERAAHLHKLIPEARIGIGHGQMDEEALEEVMLEFSQGKWDVLVCTTIIESGLDMPNVNTLIVDEADRLGLTQLYQLRGRVGRGSQRAYAYFLYNRGKYLTPQAKKRLETIYEATELGAGFRIAMKDLEIRGAGNLLGAEQSGQIGAVGFDLYCQLLAEAVEGLRAKREGREYHPPLPSPTVALPLPTYIPEEYIPDPHLRLGVYQRLVKVKAPEETEEMARELVDRFGPLPPPVVNLLYGVRIKFLGAQAEVVTIISEGGQIVLNPAEGRKLDKSWTGPGIRVGRDQVRLDWKLLGEGWPQALEALLKKMGS